MPRKNALRPMRGLTFRRGFNEAGADAPEKHRLQAMVGQLDYGFNEAGADAPEKRFGPDGLGGG